VCPINKNLRQGCSISVLSDTFSDQWNAYIYIYIYVYLFNITCLKTAQILKMKCRVFTSQNKLGLFSNETEIEKKIRTAQAVHPIGCECNSEVVWQFFIA